jgi:UDP-N-acetylmuramoyl-L-alanyl-D-glutamate--2,6-diaminopimelate ligase
MDLKRLLQAVEIKKMTGPTEKKIEGIAYHSQQVKKGFLFAALRGAEVDGHRFVSDALERGAEAFLLEEEREIPDKTGIWVADSRRALARVSANFFGNPSSRMRLIGVTGTNGKTTTTYLLESILKKAGRQPGVVGTINYRYGQKSVVSANTTPESLDLQRILHEMVEAGVSDVIMEVSSHGLDLHRVYGCQFDGVIFTNFTSDHLDYHRTLEHYFQSKRKLFSDILTMSPKAGRFAVTNLDDPKGEAMVEGVRLPVIRYGLDPTSEISADQATSTFDGLSCRIRTPRGSFSLHSKLIGEFNLHNILAAVATGTGLSIPSEVLKEGIEALDGVPGRFEKVENQKGIHVVVDYAHTQDALERVLLGLRKILDGSPKGMSPAGGKTITVFGCGGDRDRTKRPLMGEMAGKYSDLSILTSDNPRTEDPLAIMNEVEAGLKRLSLEEWSSDGLSRWREKKGYFKVPDRREAIRTAIRLAQPSDTVLIAGKGHEDYQIIGKKKYPFDDRVEARKAMGES